MGRVLQEAWQLPHYFDAGQGTSAHNDTALTSTALESLRPLPRVTEIVFDGQGGRSGRPLGRLPAQLGVY